MKEHFFTEMYSSKYFLFNDIKQLKFKNCINATHLKLKINFYSSRLSNKINYFAVTKLLFFSQTVKAEFPKLGK